MTEQQDAPASGTILAGGGVVASLAEALGRPLLASADAGEVVITLRDPAGMDFAVRPPSGRTIVIDSDAGHGGHAQGPEPKELLLVALAGCSGMDVLAILRKKRQVLTDYRVRVAGVEATQHPRVFTLIVVEHIVSGPAVDPAAVARAVELSATRYCPVSAMLARACPITHQFRIVRAAGLAGL